MCLCAGSGELTGHAEKISLRDAIKQRLATHERMLARWLHDMRGRDALLAHFPKILSTSGEAPRPSLVVTLGDGQDAVDQDVDDAEDDRSSVYSDDVEGEDDPSRTCLTTWQLLPWRKWLWTKRMQQQQHETPAPPGTSYVARCFALLVLI